MAAVIVIMVMVMVMVIMVMVSVRDERVGFSLQISQLPLTESPLMHMSHG